MDGSDAVFCYSADLAELPLATTNHGRPPYNFEHVSFPFPPSSRRRRRRCRASDAAAQAAGDVSGHPAQRQLHADGIRGCRDSALFQQRPRNGDANHVKSAP